MGAVTCLGVGHKNLWNAVVEGKTGLVDGFGRVPQNLYSELEKSLNLQSGVSRAHVLAESAAREAMGHAKWHGLSESDGLILATTTGQIDLWEREIVDYLSGKITRQAFEPACRQQALGGILESISNALDFRGPSLLLSSACSASTQALALGATWVKQNKVKRCLVGGVEILSKLTIEGFRSLQLLNPNPATPFDRNRKGINLSEGAAFFCLEKEGSEKLAYIVGSGMSSDAYHMTSPHPEGAGCYAAMKKALDEAEISPSQIDWVHAHGTGSVANDASEGLALQRLFNGQTPWVTSTKGIHGHGLGASGAIESVICVSALGDQKIPPTFGLRDSDVMVKHPPQVMVTPLRKILKNTLGFGGNNAALVFER